MQGEQSLPVSFKQFLNDLPGMGIVMFPLYILVAAVH